MMLKVLHVFKTVSQLLLIALKSLCNFLLVLMHEQLPLLHKGSNPRFHDE